MVLDHLGNEYSTTAIMCNHYGININTYRTRRAAGKSIEESLKSKKLNTYKDHLENEYTSLKDMCKTYGISEQTYRNRQKKGLSIKDILTGESQREKKCIDHLGNEFNSVEQMCNNHKVTRPTFEGRKKANFSLEDCLNPNLETYIPLVMIKDHLGNEFKNVVTMCKHWNISVKTYRFRLGSGWSLEDALTKELFYGNNVVDHLGNSFSSTAEMCRHWNINMTTYISRIKAGYTKKEALTHTRKFKILGMVFNSKLDACRFFDRDITTYNSKMKQAELNDRLAFIIPLNERVIRACKRNGKYYYRATWSNKLVTDIEIVRKYRPELLSIYKKEMKEIACEDIPDKYTIFEDNNGNLFSSLRLLCNYNGIHEITVTKKLAQGISLFNILEEKRFEQSSKTKVATYMQGTEYSTFADMLKQYNKKRGGIEYRLNIGIERIIALIIDNISIKLAYISINNIAYYKLGTRSKLLTSREIIELYRPDMLKQYDLDNPTGEYTMYGVKV